MAVITDSLKPAIFNEVRLHHEKSRNCSDQELNQIIFHHNSGMRLTFTGFLILKKIFTVYSFQMASGMKSRHYIGMNTLSYPYYMTSTRLILFSEMDAMAVKLSGSIMQFLENQYNSAQDY